MSPEISKFFFSTSAQKLFIIIYHLFHSLYSNSVNLFQHILILMLDILISDTKIFLYSSLKLTLKTRFIYLFLYKCTYYIFFLLSTLNGEFTIFNTLLNNSFFPSTVLHTH